MSESDPRLPAGRSATPGGAGGEVLPMGTVAALLGAVRRRRRFIMLWTLAWLAVAALLISNLAPWYRSEAQVMLDTRQVFYADVRAVLTGPTSLAASDAARTEAEILRSPGLVRTVVTDLGLVDSPEFPPQAPLSNRLLGHVASALDWATDTLGLPLGGLARSVAASADDWVRPRGQNRFEGVVNAYRSRLGVNFDGRSYIMTVLFEASDAAEAARILNRHVEIYVEAQRRMKADALASASEWLDREIETLSARLAAAELALQEYRDQNRLFAPRGTALVAQEMSDLNTQLTAAQGDVARLEARLQSIRASGPRSEVLMDVLQSENIGSLRLQEADALRREAEAATQFGPRHPTLIAARAQRVEAQRKLQEEVRRLLQGLEGDVAVARAREENLRQAVQDLNARMAANEFAELRARELEREAAAVRSLHENLLVRRQQVSAQEGIQQADARIVSEAVPPQGPFYPRTRLFMFVAAVLSVSSGLGLALARERIRTSFGSIEEMEEGLGLPVLGALPRTSRRDPLARQVVHSPKTPAAEAVRNIRHRLALAIPQGPPHVLVVTSALRAEGKTSVALALARSMAGSGLAVLLVDADLRGPSVSRAVWGRAETEGLIAAVEGRRSLDAAIRQDPDSPLRILAAEEGTSAPQDVLASPDFADLLRTAAQAFDCIVVDTPPAGAFSDAALLARVATATIMVVRSGRTPVEAAQAAMRTLATGGAGFTAAVLNDVDIRKASGAAPYALAQYGAPRSYART